MRNLVEYPVTRSEVIQALSNATERHNEALHMYCGNLDGVALHLLQSFLDRGPIRDQLVDFLANVDQFERNRS